ncbi:hypothetical protein CLOM_g17190, partial [Closterium sp. NIES-68]
LCRSLHPLPRPLSSHDVSPQATSNQQQQQQQQQRGASGVEGVCVVSGGRDACALQGVCVVSVDDRPVRHAVTLSLLRRLGVCTLHCSSFRHLPSLLAHHHAMHHAEQEELEDEEQQEGGEEEEEREEKRPEDEESYKEDEESYKVVMSSGLSPAATPLFHALPLRSLFRPTSQSLSAGRSISLTAASTTHPPARLAPPPPSRSTSHTALTDHAQHASLAQRAQHPQLAPLTSQQCSGAPPAASLTTPSPPLLSNPTQANTGSTSSHFSPALEPFGSPAILSSPPVFRLSAATPSASSTSISPLSPAPPPRQFSCPPLSLAACSSSGKRVGGGEEEDQRQQRWWRQQGEEGEGQKDGNEEGEGQQGAHYRSLGEVERRGYVGAVVVEGEMMRRLGVTADQIHALLAGRGGGIGMAGEGEQMTEEREEGEVSKEGRGGRALEKQQHSSKSSNGSKGSKGSTQIGWPVPFLVLLQGSLPLAPDSRARDPATPDSSSPYKRDAYKGDSFSHDADLDCQREDGGGSFQQSKSGRVLTRGKSRDRRRKSRERGERAAAVAAGMGADCACKPSGRASRSRSRSPVLSLSPSPSIPSLLSLGFDAVVRKPLRKPAVLTALLPLLTVDTEHGHCKEAGGGNNEDAAQGGLRGREEECVRRRGLVRYSQELSLQWQRQKQVPADAPRSCRRCVTIECDNNESSGSRGSSGRHGQGQWGALELVSPSALHKAGSTTAAAIWQAIKSPRAVMRSSHTNSPTTPTTPTTSTTPITPTTPTTFTTPNTPVSNAGRPVSANPTTPAATSPVTAGSMSPQTSCNHASIERAKLLHAANASPTAAVSATLATHLPPRLLPPVAAVSNRFSPMTGDPSPLTNVAGKEFDAAHDMHGNGSSVFREASVDACMHGNSSLPRLETVQDTCMDGNSASLGERAASLEHLVVGATDTGASAAAAVATAVAADSTDSAVAWVGPGPLLRRAHSTDGAAAARQTNGSTASRKTRLWSHRSKSNVQKSSNARGGGAGTAATAASGASGGGGSGRTSGLESGLDFAGFSPTCALPTSLTPALSSSSVSTPSPTLTHTPSPSLSPTLAPSPAPEPPATPAPSPSPAAAAAREPATAGEKLGVLAGKRVVVVDDNLINRKVAGKLLERHGAQVTALDGGQRALDALLPGHPFHLVFMDLQMPGMDGLEATRRIRARERARGMGHVPIIALTADVIAGTREQCFAVGMDAYLSKPLEHTHLANAVWQCLHQS